MVLDPVPEVVLLHEVSHHQISRHLPSSHEFVDIILNNDVVLNLERTVVYDSFNIMLVQLDDLISFANIHHIASLHLLRIYGSFGIQYGLLHAFVIVKLPVYSDSGVVVEDIQLSLQVFHQVASSSLLGRVSTSVWRTPLISHDVIINHRLLLNIRLNRVRSRRAVFLHNIHNLVHFFSQAQDREISNSIEQIIVKWSPFINFYLLVDLLPLLGRRLHST